MVDFYEKLSADRKKAQQDGKFPEYFTTGGYQMFKESYEFEADGFKDQLKRVTKTLAKHAKTFPAEDHPYYTKITKNLGKTWEEAFFNLFWEGYAGQSTPMLANTGTDRGCNVSCSGSYIPNDIKGFGEAIKEMMLLNKEGFGTSSYLGDVQPRGTLTGRGFKANGTYPLLKLFQQSANFISQGSVRRGAWAGYLPMQHGDYDEWVTDLIKNPANQNIGWNIDDEFIEDLKNNKPEASRRFAKSLFAKKVTGKGYYWKVDHVNRAQPQMYKDKGLTNKASNLCVVPETKILTDQGHLEIGQLEGKTCNVWNGEEFSEVVVHKTGTNQPVLKVITDSGKELECTPYHKFYVMEGYGKKPVMKRASELVAGDKLINYDLPTLEGTELLIDAYLHGFIASGYFVPSRSYTVQSRLEWLSGYLDNNGETFRENDIFGVITYNYELDFLKEVQELLQTLGVDSKVHYQGIDQDLPIPRPRWALSITSRGIQHLQQSGMEFTGKLEIPTLTGEDLENELIRVVEVLDEGRLSDTYCFTESKRGMGMFNGILTGNCTEITLAADEDHTYTCVIFSMNLLKYLDWKDSGAVFVARVVLDCMCEEFIQKAKTIEGLEKAVRFTEKSRAVGLGAMGWHSYLQEQGIPLGHFQAHLENGLIFAQIEKECKDASTWMAQEWGEPEWCKGYGRRGTHDTAIAPNMSSAVLCGQVSQGIEPWYANIFTQPTAAGEMLRINPFFLKVLERKGKKLTKQLKDSIIANNGSVQHIDWLTLEEKMLLRTAFEEDQRTLLRLASNRQQHIDQAQSLNLFFAAEEDAKYIAEIHKELILDDNIKSGYYLRTMAGVQAAKDECLACQ